MNKSSFIIYLIILSLLSTTAGLAQSSKKLRDSLEKILPTQSGETKSKTLLALSKSYWNVKNDSSLYFAEEARNNSEQSGDQLGIAEAKRIIGVTNWYLRKSPDDIKPFLDQALIIYKNKNNPKGIADTYNNIGSFYNYIKNFSTSILYYDSSLAFYRQLKDLKGEAAVLNYIGICYQSMGEFKKAIDYTLQGLVIRKKTDDHLGIIFSYINVGNIFLAGGQTDMAIRYYNQGLDYADSNKIVPPAMAFNMLGKSYLQLNDLSKAADYIIPSRGKYPNKAPEGLLIADLFLASGNNDSAEYYFSEITKFARQNAAQDVLAQALNGLCRISMAKKNFKRALELANEANSLQGTLSKTTVAKTAALLSELYEKKNDPAQALFFLKKQHGIMDSLINSTYQNKLAYFESKAELDNMEERMQNLSVQKSLQEKLYRQEKLIKNYLAVAAILILLAAFFVIRNINSKRKKIQSQNMLLDEQKTKVEHAYNDLKSAQAQLIQSEKMASLGELTAGIAHEIQNPLNFVNNFAEVNTELNAEGQEALKRGDLGQAEEIFLSMLDNELKIHHHGKRADAIVKAMLEHSRTSAGLNESTDLNKLADEYLRLAYQGMRARDKSFNCNIIFTPTPGLGKVNVVPADIGRVLLNLINNALYAVDEKKKQLGDGYEPGVTVTTMHTENKIEITVKDNGNGIPQKIIDKIFQPFFTTKPTGRGTGLGLSLSYDIVKAHGGEIKVNTKEGEGTEFIIQLPMN